MTYSELAQILNTIHVDRASWRNNNKLRTKGIEPNTRYKMKGNDGRWYRFYVSASRFVICIMTSHRISTLEKHCLDSEIMLED